MNRKNAIMSEGLPSQYSRKKGGMARWGDEEEGRKREGKAGERAGLGMIQMQPGWIFYGIMIEKDCLQKITSHTGDVEERLCDPGKGCD